MNAKEVNQFEMSHQEVTLYDASATGVTSLDETD